MLYTFTNKNDSVEESVSPKLSQNLKLKIIDLWKNKETNKNKKQC